MACEAHPATLPFHPPAAVQYDAQAAKAEARNQRLQGPAGPLAKRQAEDK